MRTCPECRTEVPADADVCDFCGASLSTVDDWVCRNCGATVAGAADACSVCGQLRNPEQCARHPDRSAAGACLVCGTPVCDACNRGRGNTYLCETHQGVDIVDGWATVHSTGDDIEAELISGNLMAEGIDAQVLSQKDHYSFTVDLGDMARVRVLVPAPQYEEAMRALAEQQDVAGDVAPTCPACGASYEAGDTTCGSCGASLVEDAGT
jgi:hypothetical protein